MGTGAENNEREGSTKHQHENRIKRASAILSWTGIVCCSDFAVCEICRGVREMLIKYIRNVGESETITQKSTQSSVQRFGEKQNKGSVPGETEGTKGSRAVYLVAEYVDRRP